MLEIDYAKINKEMKELLNSFEYIDKPDFNKFDYCDINDNFITLYKEEEYKKDEYDNYVVDKPSYIKRYERNNMTGVFVEY